VLRAVLFDVDFTLFRPGPELGPEGYRRVGERHGLTLEPERYAEARTFAIEELQRNHELVHDEEIWIAFTEQIVLHMGGDPGGARACATDMVREWERHENFSLYEDALPVLD
jgi:FMN phosphatase YigB (HAD superfamily)